MKHLLATRALVIAGIFGLTVGITQTASAVTTQITVTDTAITVDCVDSTDPVCQGFTGGGSPAFPTGAGTLSSTNADLYDVHPTTVAQALDILIDGDGTNDDFVESDGTKFETGGVDFLSFFTDAAYVAFKIGGGTLDGDYFFLSLLSPGDVEIIFDKNNQSSGGLSNFVTFGGTTTVIPLPATLPLFLTGLLGMGFLARRRRQMAEA